MKPMTIAIIGGGPAGATTAEMLARGGVRAIVFEERPGWEKPCGGGISHKALRRYPFLAGVAGSGKLVKDAELVAPNGSSVRFRLREPLAIHSRRGLNELLLRRAAQAGTEISADRILQLQPAGSGWELRGKLGHYQSDNIILAAGARTRLRRAIGEDFTRRDFMLTFGYYVPARDDLLRIQFFRDFEGYAWAFPRADHLSVGICGKVGEDRMSGLRERLHGFMGTFGYSSAGAAIFSHLLPSLSVESWSSLRLAGKNWALAGDAAGLVDPVTGEGIYYAMRSGELLAEALLEGLLKSYAERVEQEFGRDMVFGARLARLFYCGEVLGEANTTRLIEFAGRSRNFMNLLQDLLEGSQAYDDLGMRLYSSLLSSLGDIIGGKLSQAFSGMRMEESHPATP
jgi:geranylgeranyl reductase family protein